MKIIHISESKGIYIKKTLKVTWHPDFWNLLTCFCISNILPFLSSFFLCGLRQTQGPTLPYTTCWRKINYIGNSCNAFVTLRTCNVAYLFSRIHRNTPSIHCILNLQVLPACRKIRHGRLQLTTPNAFAFLDKLQYIIFYYTKKLQNEMVCKRFSVGLEAFEKAIIIFPCIEILDFTHLLLTTSSNNNGQFGSKLELVPVLHA